ncbi:MAG TPA: hypothetical protein PK297_10250 [Spirochaetota bacterium]|nr:hypothetical protein [Spirochaetota bacterium]
MKNVLLFSLVLVLSFAAIGCGDDDADAASPVGIWQGDPDSNIVLLLNADNTYSSAQNDTDDKMLKGSKGVYLVAGSTITFTAAQVWSGSDYVAQTFTYAAKFAINNTEMTVTTVSGTDDTGIIAGSYTKVEY